MVALVERLGDLGPLRNGIFAQTFLSWRTNAAFIETKIQESGGSVTPEAAKTIAQGLRDVMWEWHYYIGFALGGLLVMRILVGILQLKSARQLSRCKAH